MTSRGQVLLAVLLVALGSASWWLLGETAPEAPPAPPGERRPDYRVERFTATTMDAAGAPDRRLSAAELRHYAGEGASELDDPVLVLFNPEAPPWVVRSRHGLVTEGGDRIDLTGDVQVEREGRADLRPLHLATEALRIEPEAEVAHTDLPVRLTSNEDWITSERGARVHFGEELRVELFGRARGRAAVAPRGPGATSTSDAEEAP